VDGQKGFCAPKGRGTGERTGRGLSRIEAHDRPGSGAAAEQAGRAPLCRRVIRLHAAGGDGWHLRRRHAQHPSGRGPCHIKTGSPCANVRAKLPASPVTPMAESWAVAAIVNHGAAGGSVKRWTACLPNAVHRRSSTEMATSAKRHKS